MRTFLIAAACVVLASPAGWARHGDRFDLAKPGTSIEQFQQDRDGCVAHVVTLMTRQSSRAHRSNECQTLNPGPPNPGYANSGPNYNDYNHSPWGQPAAPQGYQDMRYVRYDEADRLFMKCMREQGYAVAYIRNLKNAQFQAGPLWK